MSVTLANAQIDHIVITAPSLFSGVAYVGETLGVLMEEGGEHLRMGTHNKLLRLGDALYLEVIAINPNARRPVHPRWFGLDHQTEPKLAGWVARTNDIKRAVAASPIPLGEVESMQRGDLNWLITIPPDGSFPFDGVAPVLIQWQGDSHPAQRLISSGCSLVRLEGYHAEAKTIEAMLNAIRLDDNFAVSALPPEKSPNLLALIKTPTGIRQLSSAT